MQHMRLKRQRKLGSYLGSKMVMEKKAKKRGSAASVSEQPAGVFAGKQ